MKLYSQIEDASYARGCHQTIDKIEIMIQNGATLHDIQLLSTIICDMRNKEDYEGAFLDKAIKRFRKQKQAHE